MKLYSILLLSTLLLLFSCDEKQVDAETIETTETRASNIPAELKLVLDAHGGLDQWNKMNSLSYEFNRGEKTEIQKIDLKTRKVRIEGDGYVIGNDGENIWVSPNLEAYSGKSARFYHNLLFYFYAMPFVVSDPGINYKVLDQAEVKGKTYNRISITYGENIGDTPEDEYIIYSDPETNKMEWLFYTVTFFSGEKSTKYNALNYNGWKEVNGLLVPETMSGYLSEDGVVTTKRYDNLFKDIKFSEETFDQATFEMPAEAEVEVVE
ncbi:DUF6503 family protein [Portibacter lacus]|uniref:Threonine synthase n=1 Tax=Portibacter lacus TaxID=1099794 RepID=A0AA37SSU8_9BACT|nr:DUF6503 family protein [Portibacter lacus]GLR18111.1 hypothetical protein GCM10007940_27260 [Portibacter lacus]